MNALALLPPSIRGKAKDFFTYNITFNTIAAGATATGSANIQGDSDFLWIRGSLIVTDAAGTTFTSSAAAPLLVAIGDAASGRQLQDSNTHISNVFGTAQLPFDLPYPKMFERSGQIQATLVSQAAGALVVRMAFHGFKVFDTPDK
jgi:hypothetical protein